MNLPTKGLQFTQDAAGAWGVRGMPNTPAMAIEEVEPVFDWLAALDLPKDWAKLDAMAQPRGLSPRHLRFIVADESRTRFPGAPRLQPQRYLFYPSGQLLTLGHLGYAIGLVNAVWLAQPGELAPGEVEGSAVMGEATLYGSGLADAAWQGIKQRIFGHTCGVFKTLTLTQRSGAVWQKDLLLEIALIDRPGCLNAKILKAWEA